MLFAAILLRFAFPYGLYMDMRKDGMGRGVPVKRVADNFRNTLNPGECNNQCSQSLICIYYCTGGFHEFYSLCTVSLGEIFPCKRLVKIISNLNTHSLAT